MVHLRRPGSEGATPPPGPRRSLFYASRCSLSALFSHSVICSCPVSIFPFG